MYPKNILKRTSNFLICFPKLPKIFLKMFFKFFKNYLKFFPKCFSFPQNFSFIFSRIFSVFQYFLKFLIFLFRKCQVVNFYKPQPFSLKTELELNTQNQKMSFKCWTSTFLPDVTENSDTANFWVKFSSILVKI